MTGGRAFAGALPRVASKGAWHLAVLVYAGLLFALALRRPIDGDEGFYATAIQSVSDGAVPYRDFMFPQGPLMPYAYAVATALSPHRLTSIRALSVFFTLLGAGLLFAVLRRSLGAHPRAVLLALASYCLNPVVLAWGTVAKTYALGNLLLIGGLALLTPRGDGSAAAPTLPSLGRVLGAGVLLGAVTSCRLLYLPVLLATALWLTLGRRRGGGACAWFAAGALVGLAPILVCGVLFPEQTRFGLVGYHELRADAPAWPGRAVHVLSTLGSVLTHGVFPALTLLAGPACLAWCWRHWTSPDRHSGLALWCCAGGALFLASCLPYPVYPQYFAAPLAPFATVLVAYAAARSVSWSPRGIFAALGLSCLAVLADLKGEIGRTSPGKIWRVSSVGEVAEYLELVGAGGRALSFWPGYTFESGLEQYPGLENHFALRVTDQLTRDERRQYSVVDVDELVQAVSTRALDVVVLGAWMKDFDAAASKEQRAAFDAGLRANFREARRFEDSGVIVHVLEVPAAHE